jgi:tetratricopeptide (TPR) repeat protein
MKQSRIRELLQEAFLAAGSNFDLLLRLSDVARFNDSDLRIKASEKALSIKVTPSAQLALSKALTDSILLETAEVKKPVLLRAEKLARAAISASKAPIHAMYSQLASIRQDQGDSTEAAKYYRLSLSVAKTVEERASSLRGIIETSVEPGEKDRAFVSLQGNGAIYWYDWRQRADWLHEQKRYAEAAAAYRSAAEGSGLYRDWCSSAVDFWLVNDKDSTLSAARQCIAVGASQKGSESFLQIAHRAIANILNDRGVYSEALTHAREAVALDGNDSWAYYCMAESLLGLHRTQEAINAAGQAIRLSDGKWASMHFTLGSAYFEAENYLLARQSYEKAAEMNPKDDAAAHNVAICNARLGYYRDAAKWFEEALRRNPNRTDRTDLQERIRLLRR